MVCCRQVDDFSLFAGCLFALLFAVCEIPFSFHSIVLATFYFNSHMRVPRVCGIEYIENDFRFPSNDIRLFGLLLQWIISITNIFVSFFFLHNSCGFFFCFVFCWLKLRSRHIGVSGYVQLLS